MVRNTSGRHSLHRKGPVPPGFWLNFPSPTSRKYLGGCIQMVAITLTSAALGTLETMSMVDSSMTLTRSTVGKRARHADLPFGSRMRAMVNLTDSALKASPLWNFTSRRSRNRQVVGLRPWHESARVGLGFLRNAVNWVTKRYSRRSG